jgi:hypothetical protein
MPGQDHRLALARFQNQRSSIVATKIQFVVGKDFLARGTALHSQFCSRASIEALVKNTIPEAFAFSEYKTSLCGKTNPFKSAVRPVRCWIVI